MICDPEDDKNPSTPRPVIWPEYWERYWKKRREERATFTPRVIQKQTKEERQWTLFRKNT